MTEKLYILPCKQAGVSSFVHSVLPHDEKHPIMFCAEGTANGLEIGIQGYGENSAIAGYGRPLILERRNRQLTLYVFGDINSEEPTHVISLASAHESARSRPPEDRLTPADVVSMYPDSDLLGVDLTGMDYDQAMRELEQTGGDSLLAFLVAELCNPDDEVDTDEQLMRCQRAIVDIMAVKAGIERRSNADNTG